MLWKSLLAVLLLCSVASGEKARYDNYRVLNVVIENELQMAAMQQIEEYPDGYRFWESVTNVGTTIVVPPHKFSEFAELVERLEFKTTLVTNNLQDLIDNEQPKVMPKADFSWTAYYDYAAIIAWMESLTTSYPGIVTSFSVGSTYQGRDLRAYKISYRAGNPGVFIESEIHAREWISVASVTYMVNELLTSSNPDIRDIAEHYDWYIVPIANPDGYVFTWTNDRMWRKTRSISGACIGADPNRNWGYNWMQGGASSNPCSDTFAGATPFSEIETRSISDYYKTISSNILVYISFHAYGQMLLLPYGHTTAHLDNYAESMVIAGKAVSKLRERYGTQFTYGNIAETIYVASGGSIDWVKGDQRTRFAYTYELRDLGQYGFILPANQILPTAMETLDSVIVILQEARHV